MKIHIEAFNQIGLRLGWAEVEPTDSVKFNLGKHYYHKDAWEYVVTFNEGTESEREERFHGPARDAAIAKFVHAYGVDNENH